MEKKTIKLTTAGKCEWSEICEWLIQTTKNNGDNNFFSHDRRTRKYKRK